MKYKGVRQKMSLEGGKIDDLIELEKERFQADDDRRIRMVKRADEINMEFNETRRILLQARQFVDEFS